MYGYFIWGGRRTRSLPHGIQQIIPLTLPPLGGGEWEEDIYELYPRREPYRGLASATDNRRQELIALSALAVMFNGGVQTTGCMRS